MKQLLIRGISGIIYVGLMGVAVLFHPILFAIIFSFVVTVCLLEFYQITESGNVKPQKILGTISGVFIFVITFLVIYLNWDLRLLSLLILPIVVVLINALFRRSGNHLNNTTATLSGIMYIAIPLSFFNGLVFPPPSYEFSFEMILFLFIIIWLFDTGAYLTGILIGKTPLFPKISPKKTVEGLVGGLLLAFVAAFAIRTLFPSLDGYKPYILTGVISIFGVFGDFVESQWKRSVAVKDSGKIMPGHGGLLDRFDSLLLAGPAAYIAILLMNM